MKDYHQYLTREDLDEKIDCILGINQPKTKIGKMKHQFNVWLKKLKRHIKGRL